MSKSRTILTWSVFWFCLAVVIILTSPITQAASTYNYTCTDLEVQSGSPQTCVGSTLGFTAGVAESAYTTMNGLNLLGGGGTHYISFVVTGGSGTGIIDCSGSCTSGPVNFTGSVTDQVLTSTGAGPFGGLYFANNSSFNGSISSICVTDTIGGCAGGGGGGTSTTSTTTLSIVDNPAQNVFNGVILFLGTAFMAVWFFSKKR